MKLKEDFLEKSAQNSVGSIVTPTKTMAENGSANLHTISSAKCQGGSRETTEQLEEAIRGLNNLQAEIATYVKEEEWTDRKEIQLELGQSLINANENTANLTEPNGNEFSTLGSSVVVIQNLLGDTHNICCRMVDDNKENTLKLDGELEKCQEEMEQLKKELAYATRCVSDLEINMMINGSGTESDTEAQAAERELEVTVYRLREENGRLHLQVKALQQELFLAKTRPTNLLGFTHSHSETNGHLNGIAEEDESPTTSSYSPSAEERARMDAANGNNLTTHKSGSSGYVSNGFLDDSTDSNSSSNRTYDSISSPENGEVLQETVGKLQRELVLSREALSALKLDRKRLKSEKCELLNQMKEVYSTLEGKERELRDFIRQYEQRMRDSDKGMRELVLEKERAEEQRREIVSSVQEAESKVEGLKGSLRTKDDEISRLQLQLRELQGRFVLLTGQKPSMSSSIDSFPSSQPHRNINHIQRTPSMGYASLPVSPASDETANYDSNKKNNINTPNTAPLQRGSSITNSLSSQSTLKDNHQEPADPVPSVGASMAAASNKRIVERRISIDPLESPPPDGAGYVEVKMRNKTRNRSRQSASTDRNRFSKLFGLGRSKTRDFSMDAEQRNSTKLRRSSYAVGFPSTPPDDPIAADLSLAEKAEKLLEARQMSLVRWKQAHIMAWLELELGMTPTHIKAFGENVKSGKILLSLTDHELENTLLVYHPMHKKKLRLAIEEYRVPSLCKFPAMREVTWQYISSHFLSACGLEQFTEKFRSNLVDGRVLNQITKKHLEKYLGVSKKFFQLSLIKGVELLRRFQFDVKALSKRRSECDRNCTDLLVWSNDRLRKWVEQIDLQEYAGNLQNSGVHGALAVLEHSFSTDTLAEALGIPTHKTMLRGHLNSEFTTLLMEARSHLDDNHHSSTPKSRHGGSLGRAFERSYSPAGFQFSDPEATTPRKRGGLRSSFGKVFGKMRRSTDDNDFSPGRPLSASKSMPENARSPIQTLTPKNNGRDDHHQGTMSSTTSDLGSSIERSQHMKTILGTPKVLIQPPMTGNLSSTEKSVKTSNYGANHPDTLSQSADSAISTDMEPSPPTRVTPACGITIKMRSKSAGRVGFSPGIRPHSIADFSPINRLPSSKQSSLSERTTLEQDCPFLLSPERLQNWLSVDDFSSETVAECNLPSTPPLERRNIGTISEQAETEIEGELMEHKAIGTTKGIWEQGERIFSSVSNSVISPGRSSRPQSLPVKYLEEFERIKNREAQNGLRGRSRKKKEPPLARIDLQETDL